MNRYKVMKIVSQFLLTIIIIVCVFLLLLNLNVISLSSSYLPEVLTINHEELGVKVGDTYQLETNVLPTNVNYGRIKWLSSDSNIASVNETTGYIETHQVGKVTIKAVVPLNNLEAECLLHVTKEDIVVNNIKFYSDEINLAVGQSHTLKYQVLPNNATLHYFEFISSDTSVLVVNDNGVIKALGSGSAIVTIKSKITNAYDTILVNVYEYSTNKFLSTNSIANNGTYPDTNTYYKTKMINLSQSSLELSIDEKTNLTATVFPANAKQLVNWTSSNNKIVTVDHNGIVTGINVGKANIIATSIDGEISVCQVTVIKDKDDNENNTINIIDEFINLNVGAIQKIDYHFCLMNNNKEIIWTSSNENVASIDNGIISAKSTGSCIIKATSIDGKYSDRVTINVNNVDEIISLKNIMFADSEYEANVNETITLNPIIKPNNATNNFLTWTSSNQNVATVLNGVVHCLSEGTATITVSNGVINASVKIIVSKTNPSLITIENSEKGLGIAVNKSTYLVSKIIPSNATNKNISWSSSNNSIVKVNNYGMITGVRKGKATISAKTINGKIDSIVVTVY